MIRKKEEEMFNSLVTNAFDFLRESINQLEESPKYSVINFCAAIEIFLKARLMVEHWSLILDDPAKADIVEFQNGDFKSVVMENAILRLHSIANTRISDEAKKSFNEIRKHRNKLIHFFHPNYTATPDEKAIDKIITEQCRAWYHLHALLTKDWSSHFADHLKEIDELHKSMRKQRGYLQAKYKSILLGIETGKQKGNIFAQCPSCIVETGRETKIIFGPLVETKCLICDEQSLQLKIKCPCCKKDNFIHSGRGECADCNTKIELDNLIQILGDFEEPAYCHDCFIHAQSVIPVENKNLCLVCLTIHEEPQQCSWCVRWVTGDVEDSYTFGCILCGGFLSHEMSKPD